MRSWISTDENPEFSLQNLPYGVFSTQEDPKHRIGVALGSYVLDLKVLARHQTFQELSFDSTSLEQETLNQFAGLGREVHRELRQFLQEILSTDASSREVLRDNDDLRRRAFVPLKDVEMHLPMQIGDYTDFFTSPYHAQNCTEIVRPGTQLPASFWRQPLGYHGRASSIVVSGTPLRRPKGQFLLENGTPTFGPCQKLDFEVEFAAFIGQGIEMGDSIGVDEAEKHIFGFVLLNDWSARDIQRAEVGLMGPLNGKNFATSISPWVVPVDALEPYRTTSLLKDTPMPYLDATQKESVYDIPVDAYVKVGSHEYHVGQCNTKNILFSFSQMLAHHTVGGCPMQAGDLLASGTLSGPTEAELGCFLELAKDGTKPYEAESAGKRLTRSWLEDGDVVSFRVGKPRGGKALPIGFGACEGQILPVK